MANPRPYLRSVQKIEWGSTFGKILGGPERKMKFSETRQNLPKTERSAPSGRRAPLSLILIRWPLANRPRPFPEGVFVIPGIFNMFLGIVLNWFPKLYKPYYSLNQFIPSLFYIHSQTSLPRNSSSPNSIVEAWSSIEEDSTVGILIFFRQKILRYVGFIFGNSFLPKNPSISL